MNTQTISQVDERQTLLENEKYWDAAAQECRDAGIDDTECVCAAQLYRRQLWLLDHEG